MRSTAVHSSIHEVAAEPRQRDGLAKVLSRTTAVVAGHSASDAETETAVPKVNLKEATPETQAITFSGCPSLPDAAHTAVRTTATTTATNSRPSTATEPNVGRGKEKAVEMTTAPLR